ncbi:hypothetical protein I302_100041 [Kwoniella bestiolae CBS 10118]|uniref:Uncharacterized protein n=1 Tax=Kwoniella bestiolae CBS 10118 TaxID=1296100 RepID=A0A1B9G417_9TREE|nr:hypothetical protein I302_03413 [Kwoniella bestiolae CBS 10118]OCF25740.1 hypothetical protein I302_03413 [Kwoniella bestiolae CBS 10118]
MSSVCDSLSPIDLPKLQARLAERSSHLESTKAQIRALLPTDDEDTEKPKTNEELITDNILWRRRCAILESKLSKIRTELNTAKETISKLNDTDTVSHRPSSGWVMTNFPNRRDMGWSSRWKSRWDSRGDLHWNPRVDSRSDSTRRNTTLDRKSLEKERDHLEKQIDDLTVPIVKAEECLAYMSRPGWRKNYSMHLQEWMDPVEVHLNMYRFRNDIIDALTKTWREKSVVRDFVPQGEESLIWAKIPYLAEEKSREMIHQTTVQCIQGWYDELSKHRVLSIESEGGEGDESRSRQSQWEKFGWQVNCERTEDNKGCRAVVGSCLPNSDFKKLAQVEIQDPPVHDENIAQLLKKYGYNERGWEES